MFRMMRILYIYPHPDDESFGPGHAMHKQRRDGHEVYLLTLTRGGATRRRHDYGLSIEEMGEVRYREMLNVEKVLKLSGMTVLDLPDSGLKEMDPRDIEAVIRQEIERLQPQVIVTYAVHGISGFHDHLVTHAVVKRLFVDMREEYNWLQRFAMITLTEEESKVSPMFRLNGSKPEDIDCLMAVEDEDIEAVQRALDCYTTFLETIEGAGVRNVFSHITPYEIYDEQHDPPLDDLFAGLDA